MASKVEEYRRNAEAAERKAAEVTDAEAKAIYRTVAAHWRALIEKTERSG